VEFTGVAPDSGIFVSLRKALGAPLQSTTAPQAVSLTSAMQHSRSGEIGKPEGLQILKL